MPREQVEQKIEGFLRSGIAQGVAPGMACAIGSADRAYFGYAGRHRYEGDSPSVDQGTLWDIASLTKVVATTNIAMRMNECGDLEIDDYVQRIVLEFVGDHKHDVTVRHLLQHTSGLPAYGDYSRYTNALEVKDEILRTELEGLPGEMETYSCLGFVALAEVVERRNRIGLDELFREKIGGPLDLQETVFKPTKDQRVRCAPTETTTEWRTRLEDMRGFQRVDSEFIQGSAHDPIAYLTGGVSGNSGLFSTAHDLAKVAQAWLRAVGASDPEMNGSLAASPIFCKSTMSKFIVPRIPGGHGLGFDTKSPIGSQAGSRFSARTFGHTGFTGTRMWVDPESGVFGVLLTNRVHPSSTNEKIMEFSPRFFDFVHELLT